METRNDHRANLAIAAIMTAALLAWLFFRWGGGLDGPRPAAAAIDPIAAAGGATDARDGGDPLQRTLVAPDPSEAALRIRGRVLDSDGTPVEAALVGSAASERPGLTGQDGRFDVGAEAGERSIALLVLAPRHAPLLSQHDVAEAACEIDVGDLRVHEGGRIRGRIEDGSGVPVAGAVAMALPAGRPWPHSLDLGRLLPPATAGGDGGFAFVHLADGQYRVTASAPGRRDARSATLTVTGGAVADTGVLVLELGHMLTGRVLGPDDSPIGGATVSLRRRGGGSSRFDGQVSTQADGRFGFDALPPGPLELEVAKQGFQRHRRSDIDPTAAADLVVRLEAGLSVECAVTDARTGEPVERFAATIRPIGRLDPTTDGTLAQQLRRRVDELRAEAAAADAGDRERLARIAVEFEGRLGRVAELGDSRPRAVRADLGEGTQHAGGRLAFEGLEEGLYSIGVASPDHAFAEVEPIEVRSGVPAQVVRVALDRGHSLAGVVVSQHDGAPIAGAKVDLVRVFEPPPEQRERRRSLYPWVFAQTGPTGVIVMTTVTDRDGRFEFTNAAPGRCLLAIRHAAIGDHDTAPFPLQGAMDAMRIAVGARARLTGRVLDAPPGEQVEVLVLGGHGTMRREPVAADGTYAFDDLQPGSYLVRALPAGSRTHESRLFGAIFPLHAGAVARDAIPPRDVELAAGESRRFDVAMSLPATGSVAGTVAVNGQPGKGVRTLLRPLPGEAPGAGGQSQRGDGDEFGRFTIASVPEGRYLLTVYGATRQELHSEPITVTAHAAATVQLDLAAGRVRGRVVAADGARPEDLRGSVWVLPGAAAAPDDLFAYRREHRAHRLRIRDGAFDDESLTPGRAIVVAEVDGRPRMVIETVVPAAGVRDLELFVEVRK